MPEISQTPKESPHSLDYEMHAHTCEDPTELISDMEAGLVQLGQSLYPFRMTWRLKSIWRVGLNLNGSEGKR
jgi:hypothetical protein